ncbi:MAG: hypothetical protein LBP35_06755 [Candidatus Ancillula trichonymphae]|nr:hypothetical protein [Candidatus Ancillula trichonymphae]
MSNGGVAHAADYTISGVCPENGQWYVSTNVRTVSVGMIGVRMTKIPAKGMYFRVVRTRDEMNFGDIVKPTADNVLIMLPMVLLMELNSKMFSNSLQLDIQVIMILKVLKYTNAREDLQ